MKTRYLMQGLGLAYVLLLLGICLPGKNIIYRNTETCES